MRLQEGLSWLGFSDIPGVCVVHGEDEPAALVRESLLRLVLGEVRGVQTLAVVTLPLELAGQSEPFFLLLASPQQQRVDLRLSLRRCRVLAARCATQRRQTISVAFEEDRCAAAPTLTEGMKPWDGDVPSGAASSAAMTVRSRSEITFSNTMHGTWSYVRSSLVSALRKAASSSIWPCDSRSTVSSTRRSWWRRLLASVSSSDSIRNELRTMPTHKFNGGNRYLVAALLVARQRRHTVAVEQVHEEHRNANLHPPARDSTVSSHAS